MHETKIIDSILEATRFLHRDYFELETFRNYNDQTIKFCNKSIAKVEHHFKQSLTKYYKRIIFNNSETEKDFVEDYVQVSCIVDDLLNYQRSLPFFSIKITIINKNTKGKLQAKSCVTYFPALNEVYYTSVGKGAWREKLLGNDARKFRLKISNNADKAHSVVACNVNHVQSFINISKNIRIFGSSAYSLMLFLSGKLDIVAFDDQDLGNNLFIQEAGGVLFSFQDFYIATNEKINKLLQS